MKNYSSSNAKSNFIRMDSNKVIAPTFSTNNVDLFPELSTTTSSKQNDVLNYTHILTNTIEEIIIPKKQYIIVIDEKKVFTDSVNKNLLKMFDRWNTYETKYIELYGQEEYNKMYGSSIEYEWSDDEDNISDLSESDSSDEY
jgi:transposase